MAAGPTSLKRTPGALLVIVIALTCTGALQAPARRIVSLVPAVTEMLFAIGAGPNVVAVSSYDEFPAEVRALPKVGALLDPDVERTLALRPDLVVTYGSQTDLKAQLGRVGIGVFDYRHAGLAGIFLTLDDLGVAVGRTAEARRLVRDLQQALDGVRARVRGRPRVRTLLVFERDPRALRGIFVSGGRGFLHEMMEIAGAVNVFADVEREAVQPSLETLIGRAPELILEVRANGPSDPASIQAEKRAWSALTAVPAVRAGRIHLLAGEYLVVPGPRIATATEALARAIHPEVYR